jgi:hypothetical protein
MKRFVLALAVAALGLSAPAVASAQGWGGVLGEVLKAQSRAHYDDHRGNRGNRGSNEDRGNRSRGPQRGDDRGPPVYRGQERPQRGPPVYRGPERGDDRRGPQVYRDRPGPYPQPGESWRRPGPTGGEISMSQAIRIVQGAAGPGHHLDGQREERGGRTYYRIQWATDRGERRDYYVDAQTGALIGR